MCIFIVPNIETMQTINGTNLTIMVKDINASIAFYQGIGFTLKQRWEDNYAMLETTGLTIGLHPGGDEKTNSGTVSAGLMIDNIDEAKALLDQQGIAAEPIVDGGSGKYIYFKDPDATVIYFVQPKWK